MRNLIVILAVFGAIGMAVFLQQRQAGDYEQRSRELEAAIAATYVASLEQSAEARVIDLPEDGNQWHTILVLQADWRSRAAERRIEAMFHAEPFLASLKHQTHWHLITVDQPEFKKFRPLVDCTPCLIVERANGEVIYRESGPELGRHPHGLARAIRKQVQRHCPDGKCLPLHPVPGPNEPAPNEEIPAVIREQKEEPQKPKHSAAPFIVLMALAGVAGFAMKFRRAAAV